LWVGNLPFHATKAISPFPEFGPLLVWVDSGLPDRPRISNDEPELRSYDATGPIPDQPRFSAPVQMRLPALREAIAGTGTRQTQFWIRVLRKANERIASKNLHEQLTLLDVWNYASAHKWFV